MHVRRKYTNEELGINPARERRIIGIVVGTMVALLILGLIAMFILLSWDFSRQKQPQPSQPFMEFSDAAHDAPHFPRAHGRV